MCWAAESTNATPLYHRAPAPLLTRHLAPQVEHVSPVSQLHRYVHIHAQVHQLAANQAALPRGGGAHEGVADGDEGIPAEWLAKLVMCEEIATMAEQLMKLSAARKA